MNDSPRVYLEVDHRMVGWCERAVAETFETIFATPIKLRDVQIELDPLKGQQVTGVLPFVQSSLEGALALSFPKHTLISVATTFYRLMPDDITEEMLIGAVSEVTSIIFNLVKEQYNQNGFRFQPSFPIVITGGNHTIYSTFPTSKLHLSFDSKHGAFTLELSAAMGK